MPAPGRFHQAVITALQKDGWTITHNPLHLTSRRHNLYVDLGAERLIAAEKESQKIAVEVKTFLGRSEIADLEQAIGQYQIYLSSLKRQEPERVLYLAVPMAVRATLFEESVGKALLEDMALNLVAYDAALEEIIQWIPSQNNS